MRADERPCASATRALPGTSSTKRRGAEGRGETRRHGACGGRSLSRERRPGPLPQLARGLTEYRNIYSDIPLIPLPAAEAAPAAVPCSGCGPRKPRAAASLHDPRPLGASSTTFPAAPASRSRTVSRLLACRRSLCLAKPSIPPFRLAPRGAFHFVHLCTLPTCRKGRGKPSASRKLKLFGFPLPPLRPFGAGASSTA